MLDAAMAAHFQRDQPGTYELCAAFNAALAMLAFPEDANRGLVSSLISVRGSPRGYSFERAAAASLSVWTFPEDMAGNYTI